MFSNYYEYNYNYPYTYYYSLDVVCGRAVRRNCLVNVYLCFVLCILIVSRLCYYSLFCR